MGETSGPGRALIKTCILSAINLVLVFLALNGVPLQDESLIYGNGMLQNIDVQTQADQD